MDFTGFYWVLFALSLDWTQFGWVLLGFTGFYWLLDRFLLSFSWLLPSFTGFHQVLPSFDDLV